MTEERRPQHTQAVFSLELMEKFVMQSAAISELVSNNSKPYWNDVRQVLDSAESYLASAQYFQAFELLGTNLSEIYDTVENNNRLNEVREIVRLHSVFNSCQQDPYTQRAFSKPRGYAGDAVMMDFVYSGTPPAETTDVGRGIFQCTTRGPMGLSVLYRRSLLSAYINDAVAKNPSARILSVASGHCRELAGTLALANEFNGEIIAFDQDSDSCAEVVRSYQGRVKTVVESVKKLMVGQVADLGKFDLIYSAGLYDYLPDPLALRLSEALKAMLAPEGRLVVGNFSRDSHGRGYLDLLMDWHLIYRTENELIRLLGETSAYKVRTFVDPHNNVIYADLSAK